MLRGCLIFLTICSTPLCYKLGEPCDNVENLCDPDQDLICRIFSHRVGMATCVKNMNSLYSLGTICSADTDCDPESQCRFRESGMGRCIKTSRLGGKGELCTGGRRDSCQNGLFCSIRHSFDKLGVCVHLE